MLYNSVWIHGITRSGKTTRLVEKLVGWQPPTSVSAERLETVPFPGQASLKTTDRSRFHNLSPVGVLVLAANGDNRLELNDRITMAVKGRFSIHATTPLGFFQDEVTLFFPLLIEQLNLKARFPLQLRPENEQELATRLWQASLEQALGQRITAIGAQTVRRMLDLLQLAALGNFTIADIPAILQQGLAGQPETRLQADFPLDPQLIGELLEQWQGWCLERGFLTYGIIAGLYGQQLLTHPVYQEHLRQRYSLVLADDVDEYPAIARLLFEVLLDRGVTGVFTYNPDGAVRLGLGADPQYLGELAERCQVETLDHRPESYLGNEIDASVVDLVMNPIFFASLPETVQSIQTTSRAQLLRRTAEVIVEAIQSRQVEARDIAVIAPGMDAIARYTLSEILKKHNIAVESLNDQRPLASSPMIRALLVLLMLVYPGLGRLVNRDAVAEMLVVMSQPLPQDFSSDSSLPVASSPLIDPVRAGLLADYCFQPDFDRPCLLPAKTFVRWDRLGYQVMAAYDEIVQWIEQQKAQQSQRLIPSPVSLIDRAIQKFFWSGGNLPYDQLSALRELLETAQRYWEVDSRLQQSARQSPISPAAQPAPTIANFIQLLQSGAVTANPFPVKAIGAASNAVVLSNVFQYRSSRRTHRWQFWLDAGSPRWLSGVDALFGYQFFLQDWSGRPLTAEDFLNANEQRLRRILLDLLGRTGERLFLCHSDLATNGQEQMGPLVTLVNASVPLSANAPV